MEDVLLSDCCKNFRILDCTLRDGGYYTDWDFDSKTVDEYILAMNQLPIDYLEVGYRNNPSKEYLGKFGYTPVSVLKHLRELSTKKLVVMLNEKSTRPEDLDSLLNPIVGLADMIRRATDPKNFLLNKDGKLVNNTSDIPWPRTQDLEPLYEINHAMFIAKREVYVEQKNRIGQKPLLHVMDEMHSFDIDWEEDFTIAEIMYKNINGK